jgi:hypothetical protein
LQYLQAVEMQMADAFDHTNGSVNPTDEKREVLLV